MLICTISPYTVSSMPLRISPTSPEIKLVKTQSLERRLLNSESLRLPEIQRQWRLTNVTSSLDDL